eukprot:6198373-Pleurochrysis_carterae.AAC.1
MSVPLLVCYASRRPHEQQCAQDISTRATFDAVASFIMMHSCSVERCICEALSPLAVRFHRKGLIILATHLR